MREFDHVGVITDDKQTEEMYVPATKVWVTNPATHPYNPAFADFFLNKQNLLPVYGEESKPVSFKLFSRKF